MASPSELFSCVDSQAILRSPVNDSSAKTHWSFAKEARFKKSKYQYQCNYLAAIPSTTFQDLKRTNSARRESALAKRLISIMANTLTTKLHRRINTTLAHLWKSTRFIKKAFLHFTPEKQFRKYLGYRSYELHRFGTG